MEAQDRRREVVLLEALLQEDPALRGALVVPHREGLHHLVEALLVVVLPEVALAAPRLVEALQEALDQTEAHPVLVVVLVYQVVLDLVVALQVVLDQEVELLVEVLGLVVAHLEEVRLEEARLEEARQVEVEGAQEVLALDLSAVQVLALALALA